jgi:enoyl-CoA hydratase
VSRGFTLEAFGAVRLLRIDTGRANAMTAAFLAELEQVMRELAADPPRGLVITGSGRSFRAGLALPDLLDLDRQSLRSFMQGFARAMAAVLTLPTPTVAAVNGHAVAGGCVLALMCDHRMMADGPGRIGLNEVALGIGLPTSVVAPLRARVPARSLAPIALAADLFAPAEALALGLVDDVVPPDDLEIVAVERAEVLAGPPAASAQVKAALLRPVLAELQQHSDAELERWLDTWFSPDGRAGVRAAVAAMGR